MDNPFLRDIVLPLLRQLQRDLGGAVSSKLIGERLGYSRRQAYNWLDRMRDLGLVELHGKKWSAV